MSDKQYKINALKNNTFNVDAVAKSLEESRVNSYQYLKFIQSELTRYKRFDFKMQDIYRNNNVNHKWSYVPRRWVQYIDYDFIETSQRLAYKRSDFYEKDLSYEDIINNHNIFTNSFLLFIDGKLFTEAVKILCKEDKTYVIFVCKEKPSDMGLPIDQMLDYIERNVDVTIIFLPNVGLTTVSTNGYKVKGTNGYKGLPYRYIKLSENAIYDDNTLAFIKYKDELSSTPTTVSFGDDGLFVDSDSVQRAIDLDSKDTSMNIQLIPLRYLYQKLELDDKWFKLPIRDYPISVKNCLVFDEDGNFIHKALVKDYYPNVYSIENIDDIIINKKIIVYVFYYENKHSILKHENMLDVYHKYVPEYLEKYKNNTIIEEIKNFIPTYVNYNIKDYQQSPYYGFPFIYKVEKMKEYIRADVNNFKKYLDNLGLRNNYYYVDVTNIDLNTRKRKDNSDTELPLKTFDEEMYMFVFRNDFRGMYDKLLIHIDGLRYETIEYYSNKNLDFVYVPCSLITETSILEIEKLTEVIKEYDFIARKGIISIDIGEFAVRNKTLYNDLFLIDKETSLYINSSDYKIYYPYNDIVELTKALDHFESNNQAYFLGNLENGLLSIFEDSEMSVENLESINIEDNVTKDDYNLSILDNKVSFVETENEGTVKYIKSHNNPNIMYKFIMNNGLVSIEELTVDQTYLNNDVFTTINGTRSLNYEESIDILLNDLFLRCERIVQLEILNDELLDKNLSLHIKKNFKVAAVEIREEELDQFEPISFVAACKNDSRYFRLYRNNRLVPRHVSEFYFHEKYKYGKIDVYPGFLRSKDDHIVVEMMPYMMKQVCFIESIPNDKVIDLKGLIDKPFSFKWHDIYINGRKIPKRDVEIISANRIKLLKTDSLKCLEIIENSRDNEYFGFKFVEDILDRLFELDPDFANNVNNSIEQDKLQDIETPIVDKVISLIEYLSRRFYDELLIKNFGLINPDLNQINETELSDYNAIFDIESPVILNPDEGSIDAVPSLIVNPDDK